MENPWVSEYSPSQDAYHVEQLTDLVANNRASIAAHGWFPDYVVIGAFTSQEDASRLCSELRRGKMLAEEVAA